MAHVVQDMEDLQSMQSSGMLQDSLDLDFWYDVSVDMAAKWLFGTWAEIPCSASTSRAWWLMSSHTLAHISFDLLPESTLRSYATAEFL